MRYIAQQDGFIDSHYVCMGEEFEYDGKTPSWARPLDGEKKPELKLTADAPVTPKKRRSPARKNKPATAPALATT
jgi:hypothetical protein